MGKNKDAITVSERGNSMTIDPRRMEVDKDYQVSLRGEKYVFRKTPDEKIEMYEVVE